MTRCPQCNCELTDSDKFCYQCGAKISKEAFCPGCGTKVNPNSAFCPNCGTPLSHARADKPTATTSSKAAAPKAKKQAVSAPTGKKKFPAKAVVFGVLGAAVVTALIFAVVMFFNGGERNDDFVLYMKDGELYINNPDSKDEAFRLTSRLIDEDDLTDEEKIELGYALGLYSCVSEDGKYIFFPDKVELDSFYGSFEYFPLYFKETSDPEAAAVEIDSDIAIYSVNSSATLVTYLKLYKDYSYGDLYQYKIGEGKKEIIASDVSDFKVSDDGKKICYLTVYSELYLTRDGEGTEMLASDIDYRSSSPLHITEDFSAVYYSKDSSLYKWVEGGNTQKIASDVDWVIKAYGTGEIYYTKQSPEDLSKVLFIDDMQEDDASYISGIWEYPAAPAYPDADDYPTADAYYAAYEAYEAEYAAYMETCDRIDAAYEAAAARDELREYYLGTGDSLYFYNGSEEILISDNCGEDFSCADESPIVSYIAYAPSDSEKIKFSEIENVYDVGSLSAMIDYAVSSSAKHYIAVGGTATPIDTDGLVPTKGIMDSSGAAVYTVACDYYVDDENSNVLYRTDISNGSVEKTEVYDRDVHPDRIYSKDDYITYLKLRGDENNESFDLYVNANKLRSNIYTGLMGIGKDSTFFYTDYNYDNESGTLYYYDGNDTAKLGDNARATIYHICTFPDDRVLFMRNYSSWKGELYEWHNGEARKLDDDIMCIRRAYQSHDYIGCWGYGFDV